MKKTKTKSSNVKPEKENIKNNEIVHLHWSYGKPIPNFLFEEISLGISLCGTKQLPRGLFVLDKSVATCPECLESAKKGPVEFVLPPKSPKPLSVPSASRSTLQKPTEGCIKVLVKNNPRKPGSGKYERMALLLKHDGKTVAEFAASGGNLETLKNAMRENIVEVLKGG